MAGKKKGTWYLQGEAGRKRAKEEEAAAKKRREDQGPRRFWLDYDSGTKGVFLDSPEFFFYEHNLKLGGKYHNYFTCIREEDSCPPCDEGSRPAYSVAGTFISFREWTDKNQVVHKFQRMLYVTRGRNLERINKQIEKRDGDLSMCLYELERGSNQTEASVGESMEFIRRMTKKELLGILIKLATKEEKKTLTKEFLDPLDYATIFAPMDAKDLAKAVGAEAPIGAEEPEEEEDLLGSSKKSKKSKKDEPEEEPEESVEDDNPTWEELGDMSRKELKKLIKAKDLDADPEDHEEDEDLMKAVAEELGVKPPKKDKKETKKETKKSTKKGKKAEPEEEEPENEGESSIDDLL